MYERFPFIWPFRLGFGVALGPKKAVLGHKMRSFGRAPTELAPGPGVPPVSLWLNNWIWQGHHLGNTMDRFGNDPARWDGATAKTERWCACLLACLPACLLLTKFKGRGV